MSSPSFRWGSRTSVEFSKGSVSYEKGLDEGRYSEKTEVERDRHIKRDEVNCIVPYLQLNKILVRVLVSQVQVSSKTVNHRTCRTKNRSAKRTSKNISMDFRVQCAKLTQMHGQI